MKALAGWMAALMLAAAPVALGGELPPGGEVQRPAEPQTRQEASAPEESEEAPAPAPQAETPAQTAQTYQSPQTGDGSLLALAGLGGSALLLAVTRKGEAGREGETFQR